MATTPQLDRIEIWDDVEPSGGVPITLVTGTILNDVIAVRRIEEINKDHRIFVHLPLQSPSWNDVSGLADRYVLRCVYDDASVEEYRIVSKQKERLKDGRKVGVVEAEGMLFELTGPKMVERTEVSGFVQPDYTLLNFTATELITDNIIPIVDSYWSLGTIDTTVELEQFVFDFDTPLAALRRLAEVTDTELEVIRVSGSSYTLGLRTNVGLGAEKPLITLDKNLVKYKKKQDTSKTANRMYGKGGGEPGNRLILGHNTWTIQAISSLVFTMPEGLVWEDDAVNLLYLGLQDGTNLTQLTDSDFSADTITVTSAAGFSVGTRARVFFDSTGKWITYLEDTASEALLGPKVGFLDAQDLQIADNFFANPQLVDWTAGDPDLFTDVEDAAGNVTSTETTDVNFTRIGGTSAHIVTTVESEGIATTAITITPSDETPYYSALVSLWLISGAVRIEIEHSVDGTFPPQEFKAWTKTTDQWVDLSIEGILLTSGTIKLKILSDGGLADFYVDGVMLSNEPAIPFFVAENSANELWRRSSVSLLARRNTDITYEAEILDANAIDSTKYPFDKLVLGGEVKVIDPDIDDGVDLRVMGLEKELILGINVKTELASRPLGLTDADIEGKDRGKDEPIENRGAAFDIANAWLTEAGDMKFKYLLNAPIGKSIRYKADATSQPTRDVATGGTSSISNSPGTELTVATGIAPNRGDEAYLTAVAFPQAAAGGVSGALVEFHLFNDPLFLTIFIEEKPSQSGSIGKLEIVITDLANRLVDVRFKTHVGGTGDYDFSDPIDGTWTIDSIIPYETTVALSGNHNSIIAYAARYTAPDGNIKFIAGQHTFDADLVPKLAVGLALIGDEVYMHYTGDEDLGSVRYKTSITAAPVPTDVNQANGTLVDGQNSNVLIHSGVNYGDTVFVRVRGFQGTGGLDANLQSPTDFEGRVKRTASQLVPIVKAVPFQGETALVGRVTLTILDPESVVNETAFKGESGFNTFNHDDPTDGTWNRDTTGPTFNLTDDVSLTEKHISQLSWAVGYLDEAAAQQYIQGSHTFDADQIPNFTIATLSVNGPQVLLNYIMDEDGAAIRHAAVKGGDPDILDVDGVPTTGTGTGTFLAGRTGQSVVVATDLAQAEVYHVRASGWSNTNQANPPTGIRSANDFIGQITFSLDTDVPVVEVKISQTGAVGTVLLSINDPAGVVDATAFNEHTGGGDYDFSTNPFAAPWNFTILPTTLNFTESVNLSEKHDAFIAWAVRYDVGNGNENHRGVVTFDKDIIPEVLCTLDASQTGVVQLQHVGDDDVAAIRYAVSTAGTHLANAVDGQAATGTGAGQFEPGRAAKTASIITLTEGQTAFVRVSAWSTTNQSDPPTGTRGNQDWEGEYTFFKGTPPPVVGVRTSMDETAGTGTLTLEILDNDSIVNGVAFDNHTGTPWSLNFTSTPFTDPWPDVDTTGPFTSGQSHSASVNTGGRKYDIWIAWAVRYDRGSGNEIIQGAMQISRNQLPEGLVWLEGPKDGEVFLNWVGDEDWLGLRYAVSTGGMPAPEDVDGNAGTGTGAGTPLAGQIGTAQSIQTDLPPEATLSVRIRGFDSAAAVVADRVTEDDFQLSTFKHKDFPRTGVTGTVLSTGARVTLVVQDAFTAVTGTAFHSLVGSADVSFPSDPATWTGFDGISPYALVSNEVDALGSDIALNEKHTTYIAWAVRYTDDASVVFWDRGVQEFGPDRIPDVKVDVQAAGPDGLDIMLTWVGDDDTGSIRRFTKATAPTLAEVQGGTVHAGRSGGPVDIGNLTAGQRIFVGVLGYTDGAGGGTESTELYIQEVVAGSGAGVTNFVEIVDSAWVAGATAGKYVLELNIKIGSAVQDVRIDLFNPPPATPDTAAGRNYTLAQITQVWDGTSGDKGEGANGSYWITLQQTAGTDVQYAPADRVGEDLTVILIPDDNTADGDLEIFVFRSPEGFETARLRTKDSGGTLAVGESLELTPLFDSAQSGKDIKLGLKASFNAGTGTSVTLDYDNGPTQTLAPTANLTIQNINNFPDGAVMNIKIGTSNDTVTFNSANFGGPQGTAFGNVLNTWVGSVVNFGGTKYVMGSGN